MTSELRAYIAYMAARLIKQQELETTIVDLEGNIERNLMAICQQRPVAPTTTLRPCGTKRSGKGQNYCMIFPEADQHTCLSVYGQLFDGYDHQSGSHFSGVLHDNLIELYDYKRSDHFSYQV